ncbi:MAG: isoprenyl transferase [Tissierellales bacterium]|jgi:undecaprenyl diphosphate synthase|nr:isoprenyl transferase [Tissierellales bacterium]
MTELNNIDKGNLPKHVAIIMDGNGRWATQKNLPRTAGHKQGVEQLKKILEAAGNLGVEVLTVYAFSTENWNRPEQEVGFLMKMILEYLKRESKELMKNSIKLQFIGEREKLPSKVFDAIEKAEKMSNANDKIIFNIALNYGGRSEIVEATKKVIKDVQSGNLSIEELNENNFQDYLYTKGLEEPDLLIRTSGEMRLSNFLLYQLAYSEFVFEEVYWPDYTPEHFYKNIVTFQKRKRRFGAV